MRDHGGINQQEFNDRAVTSKDIQPVLHLGGLQEGTSTVDI